LFSGGELISALVWRRLVRYEIDGVVYFSMRWQPTSFANIKDICESVPDRERYVREVGRLCRRFLKRVVIRDS
jgi:hypothetical protein